MKIYNKIVWDKDGNVIEEDSYDYEGPLALCGGSPPPPPPPPTITREVGQTRAKALGKSAVTRRGRGRGALISKRGTPLGVETEATGSQKSLLGIIKYMGDKLGVQ